MRGNPFHLINYSATHFFRLICQLTWTNQSRVPRHYFIRLLPIYPLGLTEPSAWDWPLCIICWFIGDRSRSHHMKAQSYCDECGQLLCNIAKFHVFSAVFITSLLVKVNIFAARLSCTHISVTHDRVLENQCFLCSLWRHQSLWLIHFSNQNGRWLTLFRVYRPCDSDF